MEKSTALNTDRYHDVMANFLLKTSLPGCDEALSNLPATFYVTQRKLPYTLALGHPRMIDLLNRSRADKPRARFLKEDRANIKLIAEKLEHSRFPGQVSVVPEGTVIFAGQPIALVSGPIAMTQLFEVVFEHAFDEPMTWAYLAMKMREEVGPDVFLSDFSLRRAGSQERAVEASKYLYIGGCDDSSNMEAAFLYEIPSVGTMAHYLVKIFMAIVTAVLEKKLEIPDSWYDEEGDLKHGQRLCFEYWLDAHPNGTVCLVDTIDLKLGMIHVIEAALSSPNRKKALKAVRIDSGDLVKGVIFTRKILDANGLKEVKIILTGDLNAEKIREIKEGLKQYIESDKRADNILKTMGIMGLALGTKGVAEIEQVAGVIFKLTEFWSVPTLKLSGTKGKETLPGLLQIWRCEDKEGKYILDITGLANEPPPKGGETVKATPLIQPFWYQGMSPELKTPQELKEFFEKQKKKFIVPLSEYAKTRVKLSDELISLKKRLQKEYLETSTSSKIQIPEGL